MNRRLLPALVAAIALPVAAVAQVTPDSPMHQSSIRAASPADRAYINSMMTMHSAMNKARFTGDADRDFLLAMIPHHQGAVQMARAELRYGKDAKVRALAMRIISAQQAEIAQMSAWLAKPSNP